MPTTSSNSNAERWEWYAAGDRSAAPAAHSALSLDNSPSRAIWEIGWVVAVPLALALVAALAFPG